MQAAQRATDQAGQQKCSPTWNWHPVRQKDGDPIVIGTAHAAAEDQREGDNVSVRDASPDRALIAYQALHLIFIQRCHEGLLWCWGKRRRGDCATVT